MEILNSAVAGKLFEKYGVLTKQELKARYDTFKETYKSIISYESELSVNMAKTQFVPACIAYADGLAQSIKSIEAVNKGKVKETRKVLAEVTDLTEDAITKSAKLEAAIKSGAPKKMKTAMEELRETIDTLEGIVPKDNWPLPSYAEMLFLY